MAPVIPDIEWYRGISESHGLTLHCPYANAYKCPKYYESLALLGNAGSTKIPDKEDKALLKYWKRSKLPPLTLEQTTSIEKSNGRVYSFSNYCPEVLFDRFGHFASSLTRYADRIDRNAAQKQLSAERAARGDWRWLWAFLTPMHYSECPLYSVIPANMEKTTGETFVDKQLAYLKCKS